MRRSTIMVVSLALISSVLLGAGTSAKAAPVCQGSDDFSTGAASWNINATWTCPENKYKWKIRAYVQIRDNPLPWYNASNGTLVNTKYQTHFINSGTYSSGCIPGTGPTRYYRIIIDYVHVWNQNGNHVTAYETEGWVGPSHYFNC